MPEETCSACGEKSVWILHTHYADMYGYCLKHAEEKPNFNKSSFWELYDKPKDE